MYSSNSITAVSNPLSVAVTVNNEPSFSLDCSDHLDVVFVDVDSTVLLLSW